MAAGAALLVRDWYMEVEGLANPSAALLKATLINTAVDIPGYGDPSREAGQPIPNFHEGWGRIDLANVAAGGRRFFDSQALSTGETFTHTFTVSVEGPFKVTLAWSDYPASPGAARTLVNDLDLVVSGPGGVSYLGNVFAGGWSQAGGAADTANNVENVYLPAAAVGEWTVEVRGANVPYGPQPFALLAAGAASDLPPGADQPPNAAVADPHEGQALSGVYRVRVLAGDDAGLSRVELSLNGGPPINLTASFDGSSYAYDWNTAAAPNGAYTLRARAFDTAGLFAASALVTVQVKNAAAGSLTWLPVLLHNLSPSPAP
jgi:hypothetical protein